MDILVCWKPPHHGWVKLNTDGCSKGMCSRAGGGGVIRDSQGRWISGFMIHIGACNAIGAELWAVLQGLQLAWSQHFLQVIVEVDSAVVVGRLNQSSICEGIHANLVFACLDYLKREWSIKVIHTLREGNFVADKLANEALLHPIGVQVIHAPSGDVLRLLDGDRFGVAWMRNVKVS